MKSILKWILIAGIIGLILSPLIISFLLYFQYQEQSNCNTWTPSEGNKSCAMPYNENKSYWNKLILGGFLIGVPISLLIFIILGAFLWGVFNTSPGMIFQGLFVGVILFYISYFLVSLITLMIIIIFSLGTALLFGFNSPNWLNYLGIIISILLYLPSIFLFHKFRKNKLFSIGIILGLLINLIIFIIFLIR